MGVQLDLNPTFRREKGKVSSPRKSKSEESKGTIVLKKNRYTRSEGNFWFLTKASINSPALLIVFFMYICELPSVGGRQ